MLASIISIAVLMAPLALAQRSINIVNGCSETVWPALFTNPDAFAKNLQPDVATGWELKSGESTRIDVKANWCGRFWARTQCDFGDNSVLPQTCTTGGCNGGLECDLNSGTGVAPVTLAEFCLDTPDGGDYYDISNVDGSNVPMTIEPSSDCKAPSCLTDINKICPEELQVKADDGSVVGCLSACQAGLDPSGQSCCTGKHNLPSTCPSSGVMHHDIFKGACPEAYAYAYDEGGSDTVLLRCDSSLESDYTVTFCPKGASNGSSPSSKPSASSVSLTSQEPTESVSKSEIEVPSVSSAAVPRPTVTSATSRPSAPTSKSRRPRPTGHHDCNDDRKGRGRHNRTE